MEYDCPSIYFPLFCIQMDDYSEGIKYTKQSPLFPKSNKGRILCTVVLYLKYVKTNLVEFHLLNSTNFILHCKCLESKSITCRASVHGGWTLLTMHEIMVL